MTTKDAALSEIPANAAHSIAMGDTPNAAGDGTNDVQAITPGMAPAVSAHNNVEATRKKPALGDVFRFQPNNCAEWSVSLFSRWRQIVDFISQGISLEKNTVKPTLVLGQPNRMFVLRMMPLALTKNK